MRELGTGAGGSREIDWARLRDGVAAANIPTLIACLYQLTGDRKWLEAPFAPTRGRGIESHDDGGLSQEIQDAIRNAAFAAMADWLKDGRIAKPRPSNDELAHILAVVMNEPVPISYGEVIAASMKLGEPEPDVEAPSTLKAIVIGAGISGISAAVQLANMGIDYTIIDKNADFGGTWWENRYPGCGVDTANLTYTFAFEPNDWSKFFPLRDEIDGYIRRTARKHDLYAKALLNTTVTRAEWLETEQCWEVTAQSADGEVKHRAQILFSAVGILNTPKFPDVEGLDTFTGDIAHTCAWPEDLRLAGKRVAVVGNGASAMQFVPAVADEVAQLTVFARSKQWAAPFPQLHQDVPEGLRYLIEIVPLYRAWFEQRLAWTFNDRLYPTLFRDPAWPHQDRAINQVNDRHREFYTQYIIDEVGDRTDLLPNLIPDYPVYLKRMLLDNGWYRTMTKPNVTLVPEGLAKVEGSTLVSTAGDRVEADVLVLATGYKATEMLGSYDVVGRNGRILREFWNGDDVSGYLGMLVPGFPNFFILVGPYTGSGHGGSMMRIMENQVHYALRVLGTMIERKAETFEVREQVYDSYRADVDAKHEQLLWSHPGASNWYRNSKGRVVAITPWRIDEYWRMTRDVNEDDLEFSSSAGRGRKTARG